MLLSTRLIIITFQRQISLSLSKPIGQHETLIESSEDQDKVVKKAIGTKMVLTKATGTKMVIKATGIHKMEYVNVTMEQTKKLNGMKATGRIHLKTIGKIRLRITSLILTGRMMHFGKIHLKTHGVMGPPPTGKTNQLNITGMRLKPTGKIHLKTAGMMELQPTGKINRLKITGIKVVKMGTGTKVIKINYFGMIK